MKKIIISVALLGIMNVISLSAMQNVYNYAKSYFSPQQAMESDTKEFNSEQTNFLVLFPLELQKKIALSLWDPIREGDVDFIARTTKSRELLSKDEAIIKKHSPKTNLSNPKSISSYSVDRTHIYTTGWIEITTKDEECGMIRSHREHYIVKIALATGQYIRGMQDPLICRITPDPKCIAVSRDESQIALLDRNGLKIADPKTKTERELPATSEKISSIHFNKQSTELIAYESTIPLKYHLIPLVSQEEHSRTSDMSLAAYFAHHGICKSLKTEVEKFRRSN